MKQTRLQTQVTDETHSALRRYQQVIVGSNRLGYTLHYELLNLLFRNFPGAVAAREVLPWIDKKGWLRREDRGEGGAHYPQED